MTRQPWVPFPHPAHSSHPWNRATPNSPHTCLKAFLLLFLQPLFWQSPSAHGQVRISLNELTPTSLQWLRMANVQSRGQNHFFRSQAALASVQLCQPPTLASGRCSPPSLHSAFICETASKELYSRVAVRKLPPCPRTNQPMLISLTIRKLF